MTLAFSCAVRYDRNHRDDATLPNPTSPTAGEREQGPHINETALFRTVGS
jgi:hypothetical protein